MGEAQLPVCGFLVLTHNFEVFKTSCSSVVSVLRLRVVVTEWAVAKL